MEGGAKKAVLIHGYHLQAKGWEEVVWGKPLEGVWGSIPRGVERAWNIQAEVVVWGTGASEKDGKKEAQVMYERALEGIEDIAQLCGTSSQELKQFVESRSVIDTDSKDTNTELRNVFAICVEKGIHEIVIVPVASQAPLATRRALWWVLEHEEYNHFQHSITLAPSDTIHPGSSMQDIVIFTPPHRGDRVYSANHIHARKTLDVIQRLSKAGKADDIEEFLKKWDELLERYNHD